MTDFHRVANKYRWQMPCPGHNTMQWVEHDCTHVLKGLEANSLDVLAQGCWCTLMLSPEQ